MYRSAPHTHLMQGMAKWNLDTTSSSSSFTESTIASPVKVPVRTTQDYQPIHCTTEPKYAHRRAVSLNVGLGPAYVPRWVPGSRITFNTDAKSFPPTPAGARSYRDIALQALRQAAKDWDQVGVVKFRQVSDTEPAVFTLVYRHDVNSGIGSGRVFAQSFFPSSDLNDRKLFVCAVAFDREYIGSLYNIFCHELGHILGLRHEFADTHPGETQLASVPMGTRNPLSVMNYFNHPRECRIQESDRYWVKQFYAYNPMDIRADAVPIAVRDRNWF